MGVQELGMEERRLDHGVGATAALRPVAAVEGTGWAKCEPGPKPQTAWVSLDAMVIDERYQRSIGARGLRVIRSMVENWDWALCGLLVLARLPEGRFEILDGQHRAVGARSHGGIRALPAIVIDCPSAELRARTFVALNSARVGTTPAQKFKAAVAAGDPEARAIHRIASKQGVRILCAIPRGNDFAVGDTLATSSLVQAYRKWGGEVLRRTFAFCVRARLGPICPDHLIAMGNLLGEEPWKGAALDVQALVDALDDWENVLDAAKLSRIDAGTTKAVALAAELYRRARMDR